MPFHDIIGNSRNISIIKRVLASGKAAHAYLFSGPEGVGRKKIALSFVEALFCSGIEGCGSCPSCRKIAAGNHPDLHVIEPDGQFIKIDQVRDLQKELSYRPYEATRKAAIIDGADRLHPAAGNALLKTIEEPPGSAILILLATTGEKVLPTIRSRCQQLLFNGISQEAIQDFLVKQGVTTATAQVAASLAGGSISRALSLCNEEIMNDRNAIINAACNLSRRNMAELFGFGELFDKERDKATQTLDLLTSFWRDMLLLQHGSQQIVNNDLLPLLEKESGRRPGRTLLGEIEYLGHIRNALLRNANVRLTMDMLAMKLAA
jgi:DNA polymerase-3 subunit delta'